MHCAKADARPREDPAAGGGGVDPIAAKLRRRPSIPNAGGKSVFKAKEAGSMVARRRREGQRQERKTRKSTENNCAAMRGKTADKEEKKRYDSVATAGIVPCPLIRQKPTLSLQVSARRDLIDCDAFNASLSTPNICAPLYLECVSHSFKIVTLLNK